MLREHLVTSDPEPDIRVMLQSAKAQIAICLRFCGYKLTCNKLRNGDETKLTNGRNVHHHADEMRCDLLRRAPDLVEALRRLMAAGSSSSSTPPSWFRHAGCEP